jgi:dipeptidyl aminopeptidase/acylaminoacyl peptidase
MQLHVRRFSPAYLTRLLLWAALALLLQACGFFGKPQEAHERLFMLSGNGLLEITGGEERLVMGSPERSFVYDSSISREGKRVAFALQLPPRLDQDNFDFGVDLYVGEAGAGELREVVRHGRIGEIINRPNWLPGGNELIFAVLGRDEQRLPDYRIEVLNLDSGERRRLVQGGLEPSLSPDGSTLAYVVFDFETGGERLMLLDLASGQSSPLLSDSEVLYNVASLAWSPDGSRLAFAAADPLSLSLPLPKGPILASLAHPELQDVWTVNLDGSHLNRIVELAYATLSLAWAGDNRHIYALGEGGFWRIDAGSREKTRIDEGMLAGRIQTIFNARQ